jgi:hypothetical protein
VLLNIYHNMKNYSDLQDINRLIPVSICIEPVGQPCVDIVVNDTIIDYHPLTQSVTYTEFVDLLNPITVSIVLTNKVYTQEYETAVIVKRLSVDNINLTPDYDYLADYQNDHGNNNPTNYLGFNGKWALTIDRPFYHWLHHVQGQGWLLT